MLFGLFVGAGLVRLVLEVSFGSQFGKLVWEENVEVGK